MSEHSNPVADFVEQYVLDNWVHFSPEGVGWTDPDSCIEHYIRNPQAFRRVQVEINRLREKSDALRERVVRDDLTEGARAELARIRELLEQDFTEIQIAEATGFKLSGVVNAIRLLRGHTPLPDELVEGLTREIAERRRM